MTEDVARSLDESLELIAKRAHEDSELATALRMVFFGTLQGCLSTARMFHQDEAAHHTSFSLRSCTVLRAPGGRDSAPGRADMTHGEDKGCETRREAKSKCGAVQHRERKQRHGTGVQRRSRARQPFQGRTLRPRPYSREQSISRYTTWLEQKIAGEDKGVCAALNEIWTAAKQGQVELEEKL